MLFDLIKFYERFPNYNECRIPMWEDVKESDDKLILKIAIPGFNREDLNLYVEDGTLFLTVDKKDVKRSYSIYTRFSGERYLFEKAKAEYLSGILKVIVPKSKPDRKTIPIDVK